MRKNLNEDSVRNWMKSAFTGWTSGGRKANEGTWLFSIAGRLYITAASSNTDDYGDGQARLQFKIAAADDLPDYDWMTMPYDKKTNDVWDTETTVDSVADIEKIAEWYVGNAENILDGFNSGELTTGKPEWDEEIVCDCI